jgi:hypothetical protein
MPLWEAEVTIGFEESLIIKATEEMVKKLYEDSLSKVLAEEILESPELNFGSSAMLGSVDEPNMRFGVRGKIRTEAKDKESARADIKARIKSKLELSGLGVYAVAIRSIKELEQPKEGRMHNIGADKGSVAEKAWLWIVDELESDGPYKSNDEVWDAFWEKAHEWAKDPDNAKALEDADMAVDDITDHIEGTEDIEIWFVEGQQEQEKLDDPVIARIEKVEEFKRGGPNYGADIGMNPGDEVLIWHDKVVMSSGGFQEGYYRVGLRGKINPDGTTVIFTHYWWEDMPEAYEDMLYDDAMALADSVGE